MSIKEVEVAKIFRNSTSYNFSSKKEISKEDIINEQDKFFTLINRKAFKALLEDIFNDESYKELVQIFDESFNTSENNFGLFKFSDINERKKASSIKVYLHKTFANYSLKSIVFLINTWLLFFDPKSNTLDVEITQSERSIINNYNEEIDKLYKELEGYLREVVRLKSHIERFDSNTKMKISKKKYNEFNDNKKTLNNIFKKATEIHNKYRKSLLIDENIASIPLLSKRINELDELVSKIRKEDSILLKVESIQTRVNDIYHTGIKKKKKVKRYIYSFLFLAFVSLGTYFVGIPYLNFPTSLSYNGTDVIITGPKGNLVNIDIPDKLINATVNEVKENAFNNNNVIKTIILPYTIQSIGSKAFANCTALQTVTLNSITPPKLGDDVFFNSEEVNILVPVESYKAYLSSWSKYKNIIFPNYNSNNKTNKICILFDSMGGSLVKNAESLNINTFYEPDTPQKEGYIFSGWWLSDDDGITLKEKFDFSNTKVRNNYKLFAKWEFANYKIIYDYQNATGNNTDLYASAAYTHPIGKLVNPIRIGYDFGGWFTAVDGKGEEVLSDKIFNYSSDITIYAYWIAKEYTITLNYDGATANNSIKSIKILSDKLIGNLPVPIKTGFTFYGWFHIKNQDAIKFTKDTKFSEYENITLIAKWETNIIFDSQGGSIVSPIKVLENEVIGELPAPSKNGCVFDGWYTDIGGKGVQYTPTTIFKNSSDITLYAKWKVLVNFDYQNATGGNTLLNQYLIYQSDINNLPLPSKAFNIFNGWFTAPAGKGKEYKINDIFMESEVITLYASWKLEINFDYQGANGGNLSPTKEVIYKGKVNSLPIPLKSGNVFLGWYTLFGGGGTKYDENSEINSDTPITLYAAWSTTLTYNYQGADGNNSISTKTVIYNSVIGDLPFPTKSECEFMGWYTEIGGAGVLVDKDDNFYSHNGLTIYAKWKTTITFNYNGADGSVTELSKDVIFNALVGNLPTPRKTGVTFIGWEYEGLTITPLSIYNFNQPIELKAKWNVALYLDYQDADSNIGDSIFFVNSNDIIGQLPTPAKEGYTFAGWWSEPQGRGFEYKAGLLYTATTSKYAYACWITTIYFDYQGATDNISIINKEIRYMDTMDTLPIPTKLGSLNTFLGWNSKIDGSGVYLNTDTRYNLDSRTLYAIWEVNVTLDYQGANNEIDTVVVIFNKTLDNLPIPLKDNNIFKGWYTEIGGKGKLYSNSLIFEENGSCILYACWEMQISFDYQGADENNDIESLNTIYNSPIVTLPRPTKTGNVFKGWYTEIGGKQKHITDETIFIENGNCILYASWEAIITFNYQGADGEYEIVNTTVLYNDTIGLLPTPTKTDHAFLGWYTDVGTNGKLYIPGETLFIEMGNCTLYAGWETLITFDIFGGDGGDECTPIKVIYNKEIGNLPRPTKLGYDFVGWFDVNGNHITAKTVFSYNTKVTLIARYGTTVMLDYQGATGNNNIDLIEVFNQMTVGNIPTPSKEGNVFLGWYTAPGGLGVLYTSETIYLESSSITLYACWQFIVRFDYQGADDNTEIISLTGRYNTKISSLPQPFKTGNEFVGWFTDVGGNGKRYIANETIYSEAGDFILYAAWKSLVTLDYQGGNSGVDSINVIYNNTFNLPNPVKTGNTFVGWFTEKGGKGIQYKSDSTVFKELGNCTLYAAWSNKIKFDYQNADGNNNLVELNVIFNSNLGQLPIPTKTGYTFLGWYKEVGGLGKKYSSMSIYEEVKDCKLYAAWEYSIKLNYEGATSGNELLYLKGISNRPFGILPTPSKSNNTFIEWYYLVDNYRVYITENTIYEDDIQFDLYAGWITLVYFDYQGADGNNSVFQTDVIYNLPLTYLPIPSKTNNIFLGWYVDIGGNGKKYISNETIYDEIGNTTLFAAWQVNLVFDYLDADVKGKDSELVIYNRKIGSLPTPTKTGFKFIGWYTELNGLGKLITSETIFTEHADLTIYPYFVIENYKVNFNNNGGNGISSINVFYNQYYELPIPTQNGYVFGGWYEAITAIEAVPQTGLVPDLGAEGAELNLVAKWLDAEVTTFGSGTEANPYLIYTNAQLVDLSRKVNNGNNFKGVYFALQNDLNLAILNWEPIGSNNNEAYYSKTTEATSRRFMGIFNGQNYVIQNCTVNKNSVDTYNGLFGYIGVGGVVKNLKLNNVNINGTSSRNSGSKGGAHSGGVAGLNSGSIINCQVLSGTVSAQASLDTHVGGIAGYMFEPGAKITNCINKATINGVAGRWSSHGGICGSANNSIIDSCTNEGNINGTVNGPINLASRYNFHGGITGVNAGIISGCTNKGNIVGIISNESGNAYASYLGGIAGYFHNSSGSANYGAVDDNKLSITVNPQITNISNTCILSGSRGSNNTLSASGSIVGILEFTNSRNKMTIHNLSNIEFVFTTASNVVAVSGVGRCVVVG